MHASLTGIGGWWDVYFMFGCLVAMTALHWGRILPEIPLGRYRLPTWPLLIAIALPVSYHVKEMHGRFSDIQIMAGLIGTIITSFLVDFALRQRRIQHRWHILAIVLFFIAFGLWNLTNANRFTSPDAYIQGHAIWHVMTAFSLGFMGILYRTEKPVASAASVHLADTAPSAEPVGQEA